MNKKKKKINLLFGAVDIGWRIKIYSEFMKSIENIDIRITSFVKLKVSTKQYRTKYDVEASFQDHSKIYQWIYSFIFFISALFKFNTFYFFSGETLLTRKLRRFEFRIYKLLGKNIIMHFVGSDIRDPKYLEWKSENIKEFLDGKESKNISASWQLDLIEDSIKYANQIIASTPDLLKIIPSAIYFPVVIDINKYQEELFNLNTAESFFKSEGKIKILHAPSNVKLKGSKIIDRVLKKIQLETDKIEFIYTPDLQKETGSTYTVGRYDLFKLYKEADVVIDQLIIGWYGLQAIEALLSNCHVLCYIGNNYIQYLSEDCPILNTNALTLEKDIINLITNYRSFEGEKVINWVTKNHTIETKGQIFNDII